LFEKLKKILVIFEMANNHMGDVDFGIKIIEAFKKFKEKYEAYYDFGFKLQLRDWSIIHPDYRQNKEIKHIKRFVETKLSDEDFIKLKNAIEENGFISICTPFDEPSVDKMEQIGFDIFKVASCSFSDWQFLERIVKVDKPIILSTGSVPLNEIDNVVSFFKHRKKDFCILHCVTEYPTNYENLQLNQIDFLRARYQNIIIGFSTHEKPDETEAIKIAIAKGAKVLEKHVGLKSDKYELNNYSATPEQIDNWLAEGVKAIKICGEENKRMEFTENALKDVKKYMRGVFANREIKSGEKIRLQDIFLALPNFENQLLAKDLSKYSEYIAKEDIKKNAPIFFNQVNYRNLREKVYDIVKQAYKMLKENNIAVPNGVECSISAHYGIENFYKYGLVMIDIINREYCKKLLINFPGQTHPEHFHKIKEETFHILSGDLTVKLDDKTVKLNKGDLFTINRGQKHLFFSEKGAIVEEISTTHIKEDSYYTDIKISQNKDRKIEFSLWFDLFE